MKKIVLVLLLFFTAFTTAYAGELPKNIEAKLKKDVPNVSIRFDGLIEYPDGTQYLPIFPMDLIKTGEEAKITLTFPAKKSLRDEPLLVLFDNNFSMLKILKSQIQSPTVIFYNEMPLCIKRGLLPQDLLVPENLVFPEELQTLIGDLNIPTKSLDDEFEYFKELDKFLKAEKTKKTILTPQPKSTGKIYPYKSGNIAYATNYQANCVYLINPSTGRIITSIPLRSNPSDMIMTNDKRYLLLTMLNSSKIAVIDLTKRAVVKEFESGLLPVSFEPDKENNIAYVANQHSSTISILDLNKMEVKDRIEVEGNPCKIVLSPDKKTMLYLDGGTETVYVIILGEDFREIKKLFKTKNLAKILFLNNKIYIASRDRDSLTVVDGISLKPKAKIQTGEKPLDMHSYNSKLYVVNAGSDTLSVIDINEDKKIKDIPLGTNGFPFKINKTDNPSKIIITTAASHEYVVVDLNKDTIVKKFPTTPIINNIILSGK